MCASLYWRKTAAARQIIGDLWLNQFHVCRGKTAHEIRHRQGPDVTEEQKSDLDDNWRWQQHRLTDFARNGCRRSMLLFRPIDDSIDKAGVKNCSH